MKKILMVASECVPFIKTGGLADVAGALPKYYPKDQYDCRVVLPKYMCMKEQYKPTLEYIKYFFINMDGRDQYVGLFQTEYEGVKFYFIDNEEHFQGDVPYGGMPWDLGKFTYFCKATLSMLPEIDFQPDVIHCNDWQTGLIPALLQGYRAQFSFYDNIKTVMTIHNLKFQGIWNIDDVKSVTGLNDSYFDYDRFEFYGLANLLKGGIAYADKVTTVSETYAKEICTERYGEGLNSLLCYRRDDLVGIENGIDYTVYNPETDPYIAETFSEKNVIGKKAANKEALQKELGLKVDRRKMMFGIISRLTDQKGFDLIRNVLNDLLQDGLQIVVLGTGERQYEDLFRFFASVYPKQLSANIRYSDELAHKIYASCDAFLMPSLFEPCGLSQMMSMRYGTLPVVRKTGGLADTVIPYNEDPENGTGFSFNDYDNGGLMYAINASKEVYFNDKNEWNKIVKRAMNRDSSWETAAKTYCRLYDELIG